MKRTPLSRYTRVNPRNEKRAAERWVVAYHSEAFVGWVRSLGCSVPSCPAEDIECAHARTRGAGGTWESVLPLCKRHHAESHQLGILTFERRVGFRMADVAAAVALRWAAFTK